MGRSVSSTPSSPDLFFYLFCWFVPQQLLIIYIYSTGALCSFTDKVFYGGSLDFIGISDLFIADPKDIYINLGLLFFIMSCYKSGFFSEEDTSLKDDMKAIKNFLKFIKIDILKVLKKEKV